MERLLVINYSRLTEDEQNRVAREFAGKMDGWVEEPKGWMLRPVNTMTFAITHAGKLYALCEGELVLIP